MPIEMRIETEPHSVGTGVAYECRMPRRIGARRPLSGGIASFDSCGSNLERYPTKLNQFDGGKSVFRAGAA